MRSIEIWKDNGGGVHVFLFRNNNIVGGWSGVEYAIEGAIDFINAFKFGNEVLEDCSGGYGFAGQFFIPFTNDEFEDMYGKLDICYCDIIYKWKENKMTARQLIKKGRGFDYVTLIDLSDIIIGVFSREEVKKSEYLDYEVVDWEVCSKTLEIILKII